MQRWFLTLVNQPEFKKVMGDVTLAKETAKYQPKKEEKPAAAAKKESKPEKPQESKPAPAKVSVLHYFPETLPCRGAPYISIAANCGCINTSRLPCGTFS